MVEKKSSATDFDFGQNTAQDDGPPLWWNETCMGPVYCRDCNKFHGYCSEVTNLKNGENMIPRSSGSNGNKGTRRSTGLPYLSAEKLTTERQAAKILGARTQPDTFRKGSDVVVVKIAFRGDTYLWSLRPGNPSLDALGDAFGDDETQWAGKSVNLFLEIDDFDNKKWMRCEAVAEPSTKTSRK